MKDVEKEVEKTWTIEYKGHRIEVVNRLKEEELIINGMTIDKSCRHLIFSYIAPHSKLSGTIELEDGTIERITVKIGGYTKLHCVVKIGKQTVLHESVTVQLLPWEHKEKIVSFIQQQVQMYKTIVDESLPDEELYYDENEPRFAPGLSDQFIDDVPTPFYVKNC